MNIYDLVYKNRSYRRFNQNQQIGTKQLRELINLARLSGSGANRQALKFLLVNDDAACSRVFPATMWAGYLKDWDGPPEGERPSAYIIILGDKNISTAFGVDHGIAAQSILLGATELGLGGCMIGSIRRDYLRNELKIPGRFEILLIIALGEPKEQVVIEDVVDKNIKYWRDKEGIHHVPKRELDDLIINMDTFK